MNLDQPLSNSGFYKRDWVCHRYGVSRSTLYLWVEKGVLPPPVKVGPRAIRFRAEDLAVFEAKLGPAQAGHSATNRLA